MSWPKAPDMATGQFTDLADQLQPAGQYMLILHGEAGVRLPSWYEFKEMSRLERKD